MASSHFLRGGGGAAEHRTVNMYRAVSYKSMLLSPQSVYVLAGATVHAPPFMLNHITRLCRPFQNVFQRFASPTGSTTSSPSVITSQPELETTNFVFRQWRAMNFTSQPSVTLYSVLPPVHWCRTLARGPNLAHSVVIFGPQVNSE